MSRNINKILIDFIFKKRYNRFKKSTERKKMYEVN